VRSDRATSAESGADNQVPGGPRGWSSGAPDALLTSWRRSSAAVFIANDTVTAHAMTSTTTINSHVPMSWSVAGSRRIVSSRTDRLDAAAWSASELIGLTPQHSAAASDCLRSAHLPACGARLPLLPELVELVERTRGVADAEPIDAVAIGGYGTAAIRQSVPRAGT